MEIIDRGKGTPIVLVPGIQGRWEWMKPAVDALATRARVITFSLADEPTCRGTFDAANGFSCYVEQVTQALDQAGIERAVIGGVSYGGPIAAAFAAHHSDRTSALVLVSALPPTWTPDARANLFLRAPRVLSPLFFIATLRMYPEIVAATPGFLAPIGAAVEHGWRALTNLVSPMRVARRVRMLEPTEGLGDVHVPTLVITGESALDRVVPVHGTREYLRLWPHARHVTIERTGHLGLVTRPHRFAEIMMNFVDEALQESGQRRRIG